MPICRWGSHRQPSSPNLPINPLQRILVRFVDELFDWAESFREPRLAEFFNYRFRHLTGSSQIFRGMDRLQQPCDGPYIAPRHVANVVATKMNCAALPLGIGKMLTEKYDTSSILTYIPLV